MWMMGCRDGSNLNFSDPFSGRRLRPLIPKPVTSTVSTATTATTATSSSSASSSSSSCFNRVYGADVFGLHNTHLEHNSKRELNAQPTSSRWNPTPEQLRTLEDLYQRGTRTPSAEQIQHITAQLRRFGKIEGKNVFYWFQNHKARERQKRRRRTDAADVEGLERKDSVAAGFEEQSKNWMASPNCSINAEESVSMSRAAAAAAASRRGEWIQCDADLLMNHSSLQRHSMGQMVRPSSSSSHPLYINSTATTTTTVSNSATQRKLVHHGDVNEEDENEFGESQTLQLFPLRNDGDDKAATSTEAPPLGSTGYQFFEFLPLKN